MANNIMKTQKTTKESNAALPIVISLLAVISTASFQPANSFIFRNNIPPTNRGHNHRPQISLFGGSNNNNNGDNIDDFDPTSSVVGDENVDPSSSVIGSGDGGGSNDDDFLWDGVAIEGAHDAEFEDDDNDDNIDPSDAFMPSASFMMGMASMPQTSGGVNSVLGQGSSTSVDENEGEAEKESFSRTMMPSGVSFFGGGGLHQRPVDLNSEEEELDEIGGDPFFLSGDDDGNENDEPNDKWGDDSEFFEWDGTIDEDAHHDFD